ncbi:hypothetical protein U3A58_10925 [Algoriphagus sp. C2-6-M1]|uniref:hypothetical protein n=1 Tax=Algoriphagus persicinus TaxID=3108754 RepID=UPI002B3F628C|nr:hypothetical protein [Algoriphagus sp. C2-6-M1]MEB2780906.1 hypothetical protein [Algoriphagus sp. C2-6-M1]
MIAKHYGLSLSVLDPTASLMNKLTTDQYQNLIKASISMFWKIRNSQSLGQKKKDQGTRGAVAGGKQLDGFI